MGGTRTIMPDKPVGEARERSGARKEAKRQRSREADCQPSKSESLSSAAAPRSGRNLAVRGASPVAVDAAAEHQASRAYGLAELTGDSLIGALRVVWATERGRELGGIIGDDWDGLTDSLIAGTKKLRAGDLTAGEDMLLNQAVALQAMFVRLTEDAFASTMIPSFDLKMRYALRAQAQCRATLETLAAIKNPPVVFARQANVTTGPQQINNAVGSLAHAGGNGSEQTKLSEAPHELRQDTRTPALTVGDDPPMASMGAIDGAPDASRQGALGPQRVERRHARHAPKAQAGAGSAKG